MSAEYWCKCGYGPGDKKTIGRHVHDNCTKEPGVHGYSETPPDISSQPTPLPDFEKTAVTSSSELRASAPVEQITSTVIDNEVTIKERSPGIGYKKSGGRRWWMVWAGLGAIGLSIPVFVLSNNGQTTNTLLQLIFALFFIGGIVTAWLGIKKREEQVIFHDIKARTALPFIGKANCFNIYYRLDRGKLVTDKISPEQLSEETLKQMEIEGRLSRLHRCRNDGEYYYVHELMPEKENGQWKPLSEWKLYPFILNDMLYFSPRELANVVTMPASTKYARPKPNKFDRIKPALLMIGAGILGVLIIIFSSPPAGGA